MRQDSDPISADEDDEPRLSLNLSVPELPLFHLQFPDSGKLRAWEKALRTVHTPPNEERSDEFDHEPSAVDEDDRKETTKIPPSSAESSFGTGVSTITAATPQPDYSEFADHSSQRPSMSMHAPIDLVLVIPTSASMMGIKMDLLRSSLRFILDNLGPRDRMGLVTFGSSTGVSHIAGLTPRSWPAWPKVMESLRANSQKRSSGDLVQGANMAMDVLMQRKTINPVSSVFIVSDSPASEYENTDFVIQRAEAAK